MQEPQFQVVFDPKAERNLSGVVAFGDFEVTEGVVYPDNGLGQFYDDLIRGRALPTVLVLRELTVSLLVGTTLFVHRPLALRPEMLSLVAACNIVGRLGLVGLAHIDRDLARFFKLLVSFLPADLSRIERQRRLETAVEWIREYVERSKLPALLAEPPAPRVLDTGSGGFVLAEGVALEDGWVDLWRQGHLWGVLMTPDQNGRRGVLVARKSAFCPMDCRRAAEVFNEAERAMGQPEGWKGDDLWVWGPDEGTVLLPTMIVDVVIRLQPSSFSGP